MENKTTEEKVNEKKETLKKIDIQYEISLTLFKTVVRNYELLYDANKGKIDGTHMSGISTLHNSLNSLLKQRNELENEINSLLDLDSNQEPQVQNNKQYNKSDMMLLLKDGSK